MKRYLVVIEETSTGYSAFSPDLAGCVSAGRTREELEKNMQEAIEFHLEGMRLEGLRVPKPASTKRANVYRLFLRLRPGERRSVALRILRDEEVLADLYDHFLIRAAVEEQGRSVAGESYRRKQGISTR